MKNKEETEGACGYLNKEISDSGNELGVFDCADRVLNTKKINSQSYISEVTPAQHSGCGAIMDLKPATLELCSSEGNKMFEGSVEEYLDGSQATVLADVIIQGRRPIFSESEETYIATRLKEWKEQGVKYTRLDVVKMASEYAVRLGKRPQGRPLTVKWFRSFLTRHPECYIRKSIRSKTEQPEKQYFSQIDTILTTYNLKESPHCIFSLIELPLPMLKNGEVSIAKGKSGNTSLNGGKSRGSFVGKIPASILLCGSAAGQALPPFFIFAGKVMDKSFLSGLTPGAGGVVSSSGQVTSEVLISFLKEHFLSQAPGRVGDTLVLLLDARIGPCLSQAVLDIGSAFKIVFVTAQPALNPELHPMTVECSSTFQHELNCELQKLRHTSESTSLSSVSVCEFLCRLYHRNMSAESLHSTFRKTGIFPFNPSACQKYYGSASDKNLEHSGKEPSLRSHKDDEDMDGILADDEGGGIQ